MNYIIEVEAKDMKMNRYDRNSTDMLFKVFPYLFGIMFVIGVIIVVIQFSVVGYLGYQALTDPEGSAQFIGKIAAEAIKPTADAIRGE